MPPGGDSSISYCQELELRSSLMGKYTWNSFLLKDLLTFTVGSQMWSFLKPAFLSNQRAI